ncbi:hypothetical protein ONZ45_g19474 [Pleurotus djamor]|nr:hypothetical protein ONZ45_g19474 [Pleurotus djamor]
MEAAHKEYLDDVQNRISGRGGYIILHKDEIGDDLTVYRYSPEKVMELLKRKVDALRSSQEFEANPTIIRGLAKNGLMEDGFEKVLEEGKIQAACDLLGQYISPELKTVLLASYNLSNLEKHISTLKQASVMTTATGSKEKDVDEPAKGNKRKTKTSHGVEQLKKANTKGMAKISSFFAAKS